VGSTTAAVRVVSIASYDNIIKKGMIFFFSIFFISA
jgi:hypothetical protein